MAMNVMERIRKYPTLNNLGFKDVLIKSNKKPKPDVDWIPASIVEAFLKDSLPVFSAVEDGKYKTWVTEGFPGAQVLGFVVGPYDIPDYDGKPSDIVSPHEARGGLVTASGSPLMAEASNEEIPDSEEGETLFPSEPILGEDDGKD